MADEPRNVEIPPLAPGNPGTASGKVLETGLPRRVKGVAPVIVEYNGQDITVSLDEEALGAGAHTHPISDIVGLQTALNAKADASALAGYATLSALAGYVPTSRTINGQPLSGDVVLPNPTIADITGLSAALALLAPLASPAFTGLPTLNGAAGTARRVQIQTAGVARWEVGGEGGSETGSNVGTNFVIQRYSDAGSLVDTPVTVSRSTGEMTLANKLRTKTPNATSAAIQIPHGVAPGSPSNGDIWTTSSGLFVRINGATVGPLGTGGGGGGITDAPSDGTLYGRLNAGWAAAAAASHTHDYTTLTNIPATFTPAAHTHAAGDTTSGTFDIARLPVASSGTSNTTQVVRADDSRLSNARTPTAHTHAQADVTNLTTDLAAKLNVTALNGGTTGQVLTKTSDADGAFAWATPSGGGGGGLLLIAYNELTGTGTHTFNASTKLWFVEGVGAGGGGGAGRKGAASSARSGGSGGAGGTFWREWFPISGFTTVDYVAGAGGAGGAAQATDSTNGAAGSSGGNSLMYPNGDANYEWRAHGGNGGGAGGTANGTGGARIGSVGTATIYNNQPGGNSSISGTGFHGGDGGGVGPGAGGAGGSLSGANAVLGYSRGSLGNRGLRGGADAINAPTGSGRNGLNGTFPHFGEGGNGGAAADAAGTNGGNGGFPGGGGGGGGATLNGAGNSGAGGNGGNGTWRIWEYG